MNDVQKINYETMRWDSNLKTKQQIPKAIDLDDRSMTSLYSTILLVACPKKIPLELTSSSMVEKMTHVVEGRFRLL